MKFLYILMLLSCPHFANCQKNTYVIPLDIEVSYNIGCPEYIEFNGQKSLSYVNYLDNSFRVRSLVDGKLLLKLKFDIEGPEGISEMIGAKFMHDSVMVMGNKHDKLFFFDLEGNLSSTLSYDTPKWGSRVFPHAGLPTLIIGDYLFIANLGYPVYYGNPFGNLRQKDQELSYKFDLKSFNLTKLPIDYPANIKNTDGYLNSDFSRVGSGKSLVYSWFYDHNLFEYSSNGNL